MGNAVPNDALLVMILLLVDSCSQMMHLQDRTAMISLQSTEACI